MPDIKGVRLDLRGWHLAEQSASEIIWLDSLENCSAVLSLNYFPIKPDIPCALSDTKSLRDSYLAMAIQNGGGLIKADVIEVGGMEAIETIYKFPLPEQAHGLNYIGSVTIPFADLSYVIKVQSGEIGTTGIREAILFAKLLPKIELDQDELNSSGSTKMKGLGKDPYDPSREYANMPTIFEDEQYDAEFPDHPLSKVRRWMKNIKQTTALDASLQKQPKFGAAKKRGIWPF